MSRHESETALDQHDGDRAAFRVHGVRYQTRDVDRAVAFYRRYLGFGLKHQQGAPVANRFSCSIQMGTLSNCSNPPHRADSECGARCRNWPKSLAERRECARPTVSMGIARKIRSSSNFWRRHHLAARGRRVRYFRHTQLRTGPTAEYKAALDALLTERGYRVAPVTIDNNDFIVADVYARARASGDRATMERVAQTYVPYMEGVTAHFENLSRQFFGYEVEQILLLHANELNADHVGDLIGMLRAGAPGCIGGCSRRGCLCRLSPRSRHSRVVQSRTAIGIGISVDPASEGEA
jgi:catechol 2,3-dioxygenase-like lactoylglutathione lyase family enzyme